MKTWEWLFIMAEQERVRAVNAYTFATVEQERRALDAMLQAQQISRECHPRSRAEQN